MKIVFMGTPEFAVPYLEYLYKENFDVAMVITQPDRPKGRGKKLQSPPIKELADKFLIPVFQPVNINSNESLDTLRDIKPDIYITVAFGQILSKKVLDIPAIGCINVHASLLPKYRGAAPIQWALLNGDSETGITTMFSDEGMDTGDMLLKDTVSIDENMTFIELHDKLSELGVGTLGKTLEKIKAGNIERIKQNNNEASLAPLKPLRNKEICKIDWNKSSKTIHDLIRGLTPYPGAFTFYKGKRMKVFNSSYFACPTHKHRPGEIVEINKCDMSVATGDGLLVINDIQLENCRKICIEECGHNFMEGEKLE